MQPDDFFATVDPAWAWSRWQPDDKQSWDQRLAAHLLRRAGFGANAKLLRALVETSFDHVLVSLFDAKGFESLVQSAPAESDLLASSALAAGDPKALSVWWLHRMLSTTTPLVEKMTLFWHGHFATGAEKVKDAQLMFEQNRLLRTHALGSIRQLVHAMARDPAMLIYLDSAVNRKAHANENFARELMELFCLGEGNYSELDVQQLARCFTGWEVRRNQFRFNSYQHDDAPKSFLGQVGIESGEQAVDVVLGSPHLPRFIVSKLFRFFVADEPTPPEHLLRPLAEQLQRDQLNVEGTLRMMLGSRLMFAPQVLARKIRSPIDWATNFINSCEITTNLKRLAQSLTELGQELFYPPNVKGWDGGRAWINSSTLVGRTNLINQIVRDPATRWDGGDAATFWRKRKVSSAVSFMEWCELHWMAVPLAPEKRSHLIETLDAIKSKDRWNDGLVLLAALPQMQLA